MEKNQSGSALWVLFSTQKDCRIHRCNLNKLAKPRSRAAEDMRGLGELNTTWRSLMTWISRSNSSTENPSNWETLNDTTKASVTWLFFMWHTLRHISAEALLPVLDTCVSASAHFHLVHHYLCEVLTSTYILPIEIQNLYSIFIGASLS